MIYSYHSSPTSYRPDLICSLVDLMIRISFHIIQVGLIIFLTALYIDHWLSVYTTTLFFPLFQNCPWHCTWQCVIHFSPVVNQEKDFIPLSLIRCKRCTRLHINSSGCMYYKVALNYFFQHLLMFDYQKPVLFCRDADLHSIK